ncbi:MAG: winged helix-turn-helix transcriptional regulator [Candidatus Hodarchaeales archaeon]
MDEIDFSISLMLMVNSRTPYSELADVFGLSVNSIYKRVKSMVELGIIQNFKTKLNVRNFPYSSNVIMFGRSPTKDKKNLMDKIGSHECIYNVIQSSGELFYFLAYTRNLKDLDSVVSLIRKEAKINDLTVGLDKNSPSALFDEKMKNQYSEKDYLIIDALRKNSRKTVSDIANEVGFSTKTITRHLNRLIDENLISFTIDWYPDKTPVNLSFMIIQSKPSKTFDELKIIDNSKKQFRGRHLFDWQFTNLPNLMISCFWTTSMKEVQEIESYLMKCDIDCVDVTIIVEGMLYSTWMDKYLDDKIMEIKDEGKLTNDPLELK